MVVPSCSTVFSLPRGPVTVVEEVLLTPEPFLKRVFDSVCELILLPPGPVVVELRRRAPASEIESVVIQSKRVATRGKCDFFMTNHFAIKQFFCNQIPKGVKSLLSHTFITVQLYQ